MRASRLISLVLLLQTRGVMTARALADELEVSTRTVVRDVQALAAAGVPVYAEHGRIGGYRLVDGYRTRLTGLDRAEAEALFLSGLPGPLRDMGRGRIAADARHKLAAALDPRHGDAPVLAAQRFHLDAPGWFHAADPPPVLVELADAVWADRRVELTYGRAGRSEPVTRIVDPCGLVLKAGVWYLVGGVDGGHRTYRVDRVVGVLPTAERFVRDEGFDLAAHWSAQAATFARSLLTEQITVRLTHAGAAALRHVVDRGAAERALAAAGEPGPDGRVTVALEVESHDVALHQLLGLGPEVEIVEPLALRTRIAAAVARAAALYSATPDRG